MTIDFIAYIIVAVEVTYAFGNILILGFCGLILAMLLINVSYSLIWPKKNREKDKPELKDNLAVTTSDSFDDFFFQQVHIANSGYYGEFFPIMKRIYERGVLAAKYSGKTLYLHLEKPNHNSIEDLGVACLVLAIKRFFDFREGKSSKGIFQNQLSFIEQRQINLEEQFQINSNEKSENAEQLRKENQAFLENSFQSTMEAQASTKNQKEIQDLKWFH